MSTGTCDEKKVCKSCDESEKCSQEEKEAHEQKLLDEKMSYIKHKFMVISGKGGVGKSTVAANVALTLAREGYAVGLMDADIHGPNIPKMLGIEDERPGASTLGLLPIITKHDLKVMSIAFFLQSKDDAVIWRGPLKHGIIKQFLGDVYWGDLDYLIIDLPPGTGDEALSVAHLLKNIDGALIVTTPQDVALLDSRKAVTFARQMKLPLVGIVENMSGFNCPHCHKTIDLFKKGGGERTSREMLVPFLGSIPIDPEIVLCGDSGRSVIGNPDHSESSDAFSTITSKWRQLLEERAESSGTKQANIT